MSRIILSHVLFLMEQRVVVIDGRRHVGGRLKFPPFSLSYVPKYLSAPSIYWHFIVVPYLSIVFNGPYYCFINFYLYQFAPSIAIDYILKFHFGPQAFNFLIGFKSLISLVSDFWFVSIVSFNSNWLYILISFRSPVFYFGFVLD
jgi:hypothetical protein